MTLCISALAQNTIVTGTIQDATGQAYSNGTWQVQFHPNGFSPTQYLLNGQPFTQLFTGTMDVNGLFSVTVADNSVVTPAGSQWDFQVCANTNTPCNTVTLTISGNTQDVSSAISSQLPALTVKLDPNPNVRPFGRAYTDSEIAFPMEGIVYYNVQDSCLHEYTRTGWVMICAGGGGGGTFNCPIPVTTGALIGATSSTSYACDNQAITDFLGHIQVQSLQTLAPYNGELQLTAQNVWQPSALPAGTTSWIAPNSITTPFRNVMWPSECTDGQTIIQQSHDTDPTGTARAFWVCGNTGNFTLTATSPIVITPSPFSSGAGVISCPTCGTSTITFQTNSVNNGSQTLLNLIAGTGITLSNSGGNTTITGTGVAVPQMSTPVQPTLSVGGTPGASTVTYLVQGLQDGAAGVYHTLTSTTATVTNANATLSSSPITLSAYETTSGQPPRCYNIYRTVGGPSQGKIATCVGKKFIDNGIAADGTTATNTNTTALDPNGLTAPLPSCNKVPASPWGVDGLPCTPNAMDDEFTWTGNGLYSPGDTNNPMWTRVNFGTSTATLTNGELIFTGQPVNGDNWRMLTQATPSTPWTFLQVWLVEANAQINSGMCIYDGTKVYAFMYQSSSTGLIVARYTNLTTFAATMGSLPGSTSTQVGWYYTKIQDTGTNLVFSYSADGVNYIQLFSEAVGTFMTPTQVGPCTDVSNASATAAMSVDYFRRTQ